MSKLRAWQVSPSDNEYAEVIFAESRAKAIYQSETYAGYADWTNCKARRIPEFDQYAETGHVPAKAMIDAGWEMECLGCYRMLRQEMEDSEGNITEPWYSPNGNAYCNEDCYQRRKKT